MASAPVNFLPAYFPHFSLGLRLEEAGPNVVLQLRVELGRIIIL